MSTSTLYVLIALMPLIPSSLVSCGAINQQIERTNSYQNLNVGCEKDYSLDYLKLALQWSPGVCLTSAEACDRGSKYSRFTIHGLWPCRNSDPMAPHYCCFQNDFDLNKLSPIMSELHNNWYAYFGKNETLADKEFWAHEWTKHGTCAKDIEKLHGELNYFKTTLDLYSKLNVLDTLAKANIVPSKSIKYNAQKIIDTLRAMNAGKAVEIECRFEHDTHAVPDLTAINLCLNSHLEPVDCPSSHPRCLREISFKSN